jgi:arylsulfatase A-like enzyme
MSTEAPDRRHDAVRKGLRRPWVASTVPDRASLALRIAPALVLAAALACSPPGPVPFQRLYHRLSDLSPAFVSPGAGVPTATIRGELRTVLRGYPSAMLLSEPKLQVPESGRVSITVPVPLAVRGAKRLGISLFSRRSRRDPPLELPFRVAPVVLREGEEVVLLDLDFAEAGGAREIHLWAHAISPVEGNGDSRATGPVEIPERATLEFGVGILEAGWSDGAIDFSVLACERRRCLTVYQESIEPSALADRGWQDRSVRLDAFGGKRISFRFDAHHRSVPPDGYMFPAWSNPRIYAPSERRSHEVNVLLISIDTLRADHLSSYGYERLTAPGIDAMLAERGTLFEACVAPATTTAASHMTMFTSLQPSVHGVRANTEWGAMAPEIGTLAQIMRSHGFATGAVTENGALSRRGFDRGFDSYLEEKSADLLVPTGHVAEGLRDARAWLDRHANQRFFFFFHTYQTHHPYVPPERYARVFGQSAGEPSRYPDGWHPDDYDREIRQTDDELREFFGGLEAAGLLDDTVVILTSDHGEAFLEHGFVSHGPTTHEEVLRVPLIFRGPGIPEGQRSSTVVGLVDLMPTILDLAGLPPVGDPMGKSLVPLIRGNGTESGREQRLLFSEAWMTFGVTADGLAPVEVPIFAVRRGAEKLSRHPDGKGFRYAYYNLDEDPGERWNRFEAEGQSVSDLREALDRYAGAMAARRAAIVRPSSQPESEPPMDPQQEERLRALGYLE